MIFKSIHHTVIGQESLLPKSVDFTPSIIIINGKPATSHLYVYNPVGFNNGVDAKSINMCDVYDIERVLKQTGGGYPIAIYTLLLEEGGQIHRLACPVPFRKYFYTMSQMREINISNLINEQIIQ